MSEQNKEKQATADYTVLRRLRHNGDKFAPGSTVELTESEAKRLIALGVVKEAEKSAEKSKSGSKGTGSGTPAEK
ncbi:hypothetical protein KDJ56_11115 [Brevibacillus composti]|uniref:DUF7210 domain-containing protein n=1 Tax=Brevibacillus composti TaxID=2796470 RepID=A0ABX7ZAR1_9BACL|nr:hypothetical protein [Brevibacillus composti]QUO43450.1 hypothetical protein KDJ56_11115 [Brevibacillus composti]